MDDVNRTAQTRFCVTDGPTYATDTLFRCVLTSLKEGVSVYPSVVASVTRLSKHGLKVSFCYGFIVWIYCVLLCYGFIVCY